MKKETSAIREKKHFANLFKSIKKQIDSDTVVETGDGYTKGIDVTIGFEFDEENGLDWNYQTGDNSYTGGAYGFRNWATTTVCPRSNCIELAQDIVDQVLEAEYV